VSRGEQWVRAMLAFAGCLATAVGLSLVVGGRLAGLGLCIAGVALMVAATSEG
jgi:hypothetical protein